MSNEPSKKSIINKISASVFAQIVSLSIAFILNIIVPKYIDEYEYAYWQTYILYANYVGILHIGLLDGIVLRYSQYDYEEIDKSLFRSQFYLLLLLDSFFSFLIIVTSVVNLSNEYRIVGILVAFAVITKNVFMYSTYSLQLTNRIREYAFASIIQKVIYGILVIVILLLETNKFFFICLAELTSEAFAFFWTIRYNRAIYIGKPCAFSEGLREAKKNITAGLFLLVSNWSAMMLIGITKMIVQWHWSELVFGKVAFSFSVTGLFLTFVSAISIVLFPTIKRLRKDQLPQLYGNIRSVLSPVLVLVLTLYFPGAYLISLWLPSYSHSIAYLGVLLPIIIYRTKVSLLTNNYLKAYRKEKLLLLINLLSLSVSVCGSLLITVILDDIDILLFFTVLVMMGMSIIAELHVSKLINHLYIKENIIEALMTIVFVICARYFPLAVGFTIYFTISIVYLSFFKKNIIGIIKRYKSDLR